MLRTASFLSLGLVLAMSAASAQSPAPAAAPKVARMPQQILYMGDAYYPQALADRGVHGVVGLQATPNADGSLGDITIVATSGSLELDTRAVSYVRGLQVAPSPGRALPARVQVAVRFTKDSVANIAGKTCADFNLDRAFFESTNPQATPAGMQVFELALGAYVVANGPSPALAGRMPKAVDATVAACRANPSATFLQAFNQALKP
jgi:TonB family protein